MWHVWRWIDHDWVGQRVRRFVDDDGTIVGHDTSTPINGEVVAWIAESGDDPALWRAALRASDGERLYEDLDESETRREGSDAPKPAGMAYVGWLPNLRPLHDQLDDQQEHH